MLVAKPRRWLVVWETCRMGDGAAWLWEEGSGKHV